MYTDVELELLEKKKTINQLILCLKGLFDKEGMERWQSSEAKSVILEVHIALQNPKINEAELQSIENQLRAKCLEYSADREQWMPKERAHPLFLLEDTYSKENEEALNQLRFMSEEDKEELIAKVHTIIQLKDANNVTPPSRPYTKLQKLGMFLMLPLGAGIAAGIVLANPFIIVPSVALLLAVGIGLFFSKEEKLLAINHAKKIEENIRIIKKLYQEIETALEHTIIPTEKAMATFQANPLVQHPQNSSVPAPTMLPLKDEAPSTAPTVEDARHGSAHQLSEVGAPPQGMLADIAAGVDFVGYDSALSNS